jgi:hypothetical protein
MIPLAILLVLVLVVFQDRRAYYLAAQVKRLQENNDWLESELFDLHRPSSDGVPLRDLPKRKAGQAAKKQ